MLFSGKTRENVFWRMEWERLLPYSEKTNKKLQHRKMNKKIKIENTFNLNNLILPTIMIKAFIDS